MDVCFGDFRYSDVLRVHRTMYFPRGTSGARYVRLQITRAHLNGELVPYNYWDPQTEVLDLRPRFRT